MGGGESGRERGAGDRQTKRKEEEDEDGEGKVREGKD